jgi:hypothetical protein
MWQWTLNWNEIRADIVVGSCPMAIADIDRIRDDTGADALLSLQSDDCRAAFGIDYEELRQHASGRGLRMVNTPMLDFDPPDQRRALPAAVKALTGLLAERHKVYVHCTAGMNRSPLTVLGYLAFVEQVPPEEAIGLIRRARPEADPSWEAFDACRQDLVDALHDHIQVRAYYVARERPDDDPVRNWYRAETDIIREAFLQPLPLPRRRRDPCRA